VRGPDDLVASAAYQPEPAAAAAARRFVRETLQLWEIAERARDVDRLIDDTVLLTSELVTNAVVHAGTALDVTCRLASGELEVAVRDRHPARMLPDIPKAPSASAERGRGLLLPSALASSWGVTYARTAKAVWFRISLAREEESADGSSFDGGTGAGPPGSGPPADAAGPGSTTHPGAGPAAETLPPGPLSPHPHTEHPDTPGPGRPGPAGPGAVPPDPVPPDTMPREPIAAGAGNASGPSALTGVAGRDGAEASYGADPAVAPGPAATTGGHRAGPAASSPAATKARAGASTGASRDAAADAGHDELASLRPDLGTLSYDELLRHTVETARDVVTADAAYALVADEDGELRVRAAAGVGVSDALFAPSVPAVFADGAAAKSLVTVPFLVDGRVTGVLGAAASTSDRFDGDDAARLQRVADRVAMSLERARLSELERKRRGRIGFLAEASDLLASTLDQEKTISLIAQLVVPRLASWCAVLLADDGGALQPAYVWHADESLIDPLAFLLGSVDPPDAAEAGRSWSLAVAATAALPEEAAGLTSDAAWCFPLAARGRRLGVVVIGRPRGDRPPREALELAEDLARRAALALDNARLYQQQQLTSQALQRSLLPPELPRIPGVDLAVAHEVAGEGNEVGGDFYDVFPAGENRWRFAIGDVCGTGPEAAAVTGLARHALRILAREGHEVADVVGRLNQLILEEGPRARFITLLHGEITVLGGGSPAAVRLCLVSAGHPLPLLLRAHHAAPGRKPAAAAPESGRGGQEGGAAAGPAPSAAVPGPLPQPAAEPQPLLGVMGDLSFCSQTVDLSPGDLMLCVTDGITERRDAGRLLDDDDGLARVLARCGGLNAGAVAARIQRAAEDFGTGPRTDDMALLVLRAL
jgi:serine phosphatase RsbU (regulator of sigma subunit)/anti-sigma regulatory factor (Ser/Thr protein kinase)